MNNFWDNAGKNNILVGEGQSLFDLDEFLKAQALLCGKHIYSSNTSRYRNKEYTLDYIINEIKKFGCKEINSLLNNNQNTTVCTMVWPWGCVTISKEEVRQDVVINIHHESKETLLAVLNKFNELTKPYPKLSWWRRTRLCSN